MLKRLDHIAIAVADLEGAVAFCEAVWGLRLEHREIVEEQGVEEAMFDLGGTRLQLVAPAGPESGIARFLDRRGEGLHHVAYEVDDLPAALEALHGRGAALIDQEPKPGPRGTKIAFVHPRGNLGVLVELVERLRGAEDAALPREQEPLE